MNRYYVHSGPLQVTVLAETAYDAAIEALQWWLGRGDAPAGGDHRASLEERLQVSRRGFRGGSRFVTFEMLALARGESPQAAWRRLLDAKYAQAN